jgi:hypothetical protein
VNENAEWEDVVLDVESRLGIDVHGVDAAIAEPQMQELQVVYKTQNKRQESRAERKNAKTQGLKKIGPSDLHIAHSMHRTCLIPIDSRSRPQALPCNQALALAYLHTFSYIFRHHCRKWRV